MRCTILGSSDQSPSPPCHAPQSGAQQGEVHSSHLTLGSRFGCLHPVTSYKLYSTLSIPIMLYGSELWSLTSTELNILERTHRKILRTIQGLPIRCPVAALQSLIGSHSISSYISQRQLAFINSIINMQASDLPKQLLEARVINPRAKGITVTWGNLLDELCLPSIKQLLSTPRNKETWKRSIKRLLNIRVTTIA